MFPEADIEFLGTFISVVHYTCSVPPFVGMWDYLFHGSMAHRGLDLINEEVLRSHAIRHTAIGTNPSEEGSDRRRGLYPTTQIFMRDRYK